MTRSHKVLGFLLVSIFGIYGCARNPAAPANTAATEARAQRLEEDFRAAAAARDSFRTRLLQAEEQQAQLRRQVESLTATAAAERADKESARADLRARTTERDNLQTQYDGFRRTIRDVLGQAEAALAPPTAPSLVGTTSPTAVRN